MPSPFSAALRHWVLRAFPRGESGLDYLQPAGDPGLFEPGSATWQIHADFAGMLAGGLCALVLQTLHPRALAGVWDHSNFREDLVGRLRRTTHFVAGTSYAPRHQAEAQIARVRRIHDQVRGHTETGEPYDANEPGLLTWVHATEAFGFLHGYRRFAGPVPVADADRYYDESRRIAEALGARDVPRTEREVGRYFEGVQGELAYTARSREVLAVLRTMRLPVPLPGVSRGVFLGAGMALLPDWAHQRLGHGRAERARFAVAVRALATAAPLFRAGLNDGPAQHACRRMGLPADWVRRGFGPSQGRQTG